MTSRALRIPAKAASTARSTGTTNVITVRLCETSEEESRMATPSTAAIASRIDATTSGRRPSEKFGTHSTRRIGGELGTGNRERGTGNGELGTGNGELGTGNDSNL